MVRKKAVKPNLKFIEKLKATLRAEPKAYDQSRFSPETGRIDKKTGEWVSIEITKNLCNTPVCMAGHGYLLLGHTAQELIDADSSDIVFDVGKAMGLPKSFTYSLFGVPEDWPEPFAFDADKIPKKKQVEKACAYLDAVVLVAQLMADNPFLTAVIADVEAHKYSE